VFGPEMFDLVYTGMGAPCWLPDVARPFLTEASRPFLTEAYGTITGIRG
jgi:hypothetical protein